MPVHRGTASAQIRRLSGIPYWGKLATEAVKELEDVLADYADDPGHATRAITELLRDPERKGIPGPGDVIRYLAGTRQAAPPPPKFVGCQRCKGTGFVEVPPIRKLFLGIEHEYSAVRRCECRKSN
jgi:hypothetical protein